MQVKKFEAKTMKEALQLVKEELGPEAIILSAKDNKKTFGLAGGGSIEITAAISEKSLNQKKYVESRLPEKDKERFRSQSAKAQKSYIENSVTRRKRISELDPRIGQGAIAQRPLTSRRYIDIADEDENKSALLNGRRVDDVLMEILRSSSQMPPQGLIERKSSKGEDVQSLKLEVEALRSLMSEIQKNPVPQTLVGSYPGAEYGLSVEMSSTFEKLKNGGLEIKTITDLLKQAGTELTQNERRRPTQIDAWVARTLMTTTRVVGEWLSFDSSQRFHLFLGPAGHGKTSALVKMAAHLTLKEAKRVVLLSTDKIKVGGSEQLKRYAQILNIPFEFVRHAQEFKTLENKYGEYDAFLVDYPGLSLKDIREIDLLKSILPLRDQQYCGHLVVSCETRDRDAEEICQRYQTSRCRDIIVTKVDESLSHGLLYNIQKASDLPLFAFGVGPHIPEDIELATPERVLDLIYKITKRS